MKYALQLLNNEIELILKKNKAGESHRYIIP